MIEQSEVILTSAYHMRKAQSVIFRRNLKAVNHAETTTAPMGACLFAYREKQKTIKVWC